MRRSLLAFAILSVVIGCAPYRQIKPKPEISPAEQGYIELKRGDKNIVLQKNRKYFVAFPAASEDNSYLVLSIPARQKIKSYFTASMVDKRPGELIPDESPYPDSVCVFPIGRAASTYYWLIENGPEEVELPMRYRYVPQWRYKFETKHAYYNETLNKNRVERTILSTLGAGFQFDNFDFVRVIDTSSRHTSALDSVYQEFLAIDKIFPPAILSSSDRAYLDFKKLKADIEEEVGFQKKHLSVLGYFHLDSRTKGRALDFLGEIGSVIDYFSRKDALPANVLTESRRTLEKRMGELPAAYDDLLSTKSDAGRFAPDFRVDALRQLEKLYQTAGVSMPENVASVSRFILDFDAKVTSIAVLKDSLSRLESAVAAQAPLPPDNFFTAIAERAQTIERAIPEPIGERHGNYRRLKSSDALNLEIATVGDAITRRAAEYREAAALVPQINVIMARGDYRSALGILRQKPHLTFLLDKYRELDRMSVNQQSEIVRTALSQNRWNQAEVALQELFADDNFLDPARIMSTKESTVRDLEDSLYTGIERATRSRVNRFLEEKIGQLENIDSLYSDSVFFPVYDVRFTTGTRRELQQRKEQLIADLASMKENEFPMRAVKLLYDQFMKNPDDNGVLRARAIVAHGKRYKGKDKDTERRISEVDPLLPKWITKPMEYRRVFAIPTTTRRKDNKYVVRFDIRVPTEAAFPVYDVNIKLPKEIAENAASAQWYDEITINKQPLKNEGRFTITAPTAANGYVCQITPVQVNKDKSNILEISFTHDSFKAHAISVMVQKPIIKKN